MEWSIATTQLPIYVYELGATPIEISLVFSVFAGMMVFSLPIWGYLSDHLEKRKPFMVLGMIGLGATFLLMTTKTQVATLILLRGSTALFVGAIVPPTWALVSDLAATRDVGKKMGILNSFQMAGFGVGPIIGGVIADNLGYAFLWIFVAGICLAGGVVFLIFGSEVAIDRSIREEKTIRDDKKSTLDLVVLYVIYAIFLLGFSILGPNRNVYYVGELGLSRTMFGLLESIGTLSSTALQPFLGSFSDKHGRRPVMVLAASSLSMGLVLLYFVRDLYQAILAAILMSNYNSFQMAASAYISDNSQSEERGRSLGFLNSVGSATRSLGAIMGGLIITGTNIQATILPSAIFPAISIIITVSALKEGRTNK